MSQHPLQHRVTPYLFLSPTLLFYAIFIVFPIGFSLCISFHRWDILTSPWEAPFIGLGNYKEIFTQVDVFVRALKNTTTYALSTVFITVALALMLALLRRWPSCSLSSF